MVLLADEWIRLEVIDKKLKPSKTREWSHLKNIPVYMKCMR